MRPHLSIYIYTFETPQRFCSEGCSSLSSDASRVSDVSNRDRTFAPQRYRPQQWGYLVFFLYFPQPTVCEIPAENLFILGVAFPGPKLMSHSSCTVAQKDKLGSTTWNLGHCQEDPRHRDQNSGHFDSIISPRQGIQNCIILTSTGKSCSSLLTCMAKLNLLAVPRTSVMVTRGSSSCVCTYGPSSYVCVCVDRWLGGEGWASL